jgi:two-component system, LytTR family, sensor kinase
MRIGRKNISPAIFTLHCLFWLAWISVFTAIQSLCKGYHEFFVWLMYYVITLPIFVANTYLIAYWLIPSYFLKRKFIFFTILVFILLVVFSVVELVVSNELVFKVFDPAKALPLGYLNFPNILISGLGNQYIILVFIAIKVVKSWHEAKGKKDELAQQNLETELEIFKYQLQPQFILSLIDELGQLAAQKSNKVPEMIVKISEFINSLLFEAKAEMIQLGTEVKLIKEFLDIQELAIGPRLKTNMAVNGIISGKVVPPMLIFPFLNNACGVVAGNKQDFECNIVVKVEKKYILFSFTLWSEKEFKIERSSNIELAKKRLHYNYENKYRLIENEDANFSEISIEIFP